MKHPYSTFERSELWSVVDQQISALEKNGDVALTTAREYVIGSLCQALVKARLVDQPNAAKGT